MAIRALVLDCGPLENPDCGTVDCIARLQLAVRRGGLELLLVNANDELLGLIGFAGLSEVLLVETRRQSEKREHPCRIEEESQLDDPSA